MVVGIAMVKDEADVIETTVGHMLTQVDRVLIADNGSTDGTREILGSMPVEVIDDPDPAYYQSVKMSALAERAHDAGAEWVVPFDADEVWVADEGRIADVLESLPGQALVCEATVFDHVAVPGETLSPWRRAEALPLRKVACRAVPGLVIHQGNHGASFPGVEHPLTVTDCLQVRHFPYRSPEQFIRKVRNGAAAYAATDLPPDVGTHWRQWGGLTDDELRDVFFKWYFRPDPESELTVDGEHQPPLIYDPIPGAVCGDADAGRAPVH